MNTSRRVRVLWLSNVPPTPMDTKKNSNFKGGWLTGAYESIKHDNSLELGFAFPSKYKFERNTKDNHSPRCFTYSLPIFLKIFKIKFLKKILLRKYIQNIIIEFNPDILHIFGTEYLHTRIAVECFNRPERSIIHIQGLVSIYAKHCLLGFPLIVKHLFLPSSIIDGTIYGQARKYLRAGVDETVAIRKVSYVMGRTEWDEACTKAINPTLNYIHCGESLRQAFYGESANWEFVKCEKYSIYFSQGSSQVKGLHLVFQILPELIKKYPDLHMYIGGHSPIGSNSKFGYIRRSSYGWYLKHLTKKNKIEKFVTFLGPQNDYQVLENLKNAHVFLSASLIENSPNSIGEALVVGTPVVSSDVGGVKNFINHGVNGFLYPVDEPYMIPYYIGKVFDDSKRAMNFSIEGKNFVRQLYSSKENGKTIKGTYKKIGLK